MATADELQQIYGQPSPDTSAAMTPSVASQNVSNADRDAMLRQVYGGGSTQTGPYPDMTPDPANRRPSLLNTSFESLPGLKLWDDISGAPARIGTEMQQTYQNAPPLIAPEATDWATRNLGWVGRNIVPPVVGGINVATKEAQALGAGGLAAASEVLSGGNPALARDVHAVLQTAPVAAAQMPPTMVRLPSAPNYTGDMPPVDVPPTAPAGPTSPSYGPPTAVPIRTPADARLVADNLYKAADASNVQLKPEFTDAWVNSLDKYPKQTPAGLASSGPNATADLVAQLKNTADAPMDSIQSIQEVDQNIQSALSKEYGPNGLSPEGKNIRQILQDFRQTYENIPSDQLSGDPQGIQTFKDARTAYAAYSRMNDLQGVIDSTEGNPNRATLIASRTNAFLNDPANVRGWTPDEIASARSAANSGFLQEWMRAEGSRLVGIGTAVMPSVAMKILGVPAQVGLSYAVRNAAENMRIARLQQAMGVLGQRVPQPGTVPPQPSFMPPQWAVSAARYAPMGGLLGDQSNSQ